MQHATKVVQCRRAFVSWMYATAAKLNKLHYHTLEFCSDLCWRNTILAQWNGLSVLQASNYIIETDASGA